MNQKNTSDQNLQGSVEISGLKKNYHQQQVLRGIDLKVKPGEVVTLIGASGSGKSTLLRCISGLEKPSEGTIKIDGVVVHGAGATPKLARKPVGMVFQSFHLFAHMTVMENLVNPQMTVQGKTRREAEKLATKLLKKVRLEGHSGKYPVHLSGGEKQRVAIARALAMTPEILLFDEPTSSLDPELVGEVLETIKALADDGLTMMIVTHELSFAREISDRIVFIDEGLICEEGEPEAVLLSPQKARTKSFISRHRMGF